jgi:X-Pro dipeptidyl-peptidase
MSTDRDYTVRPAPGTEVSIHPAASAVSLPVVGGVRALEEATETTE